MKQGKPNIIFIMADDMGYGDLGCYGAEKIPTPNMDSVAANGIKFNDAHSSSAVCTPSRYSVITGRYCWRSRLKKWVLGGFGAPLIEPERMTVASFLKENGYACGAVGKWHLGLNWKRKDGKDLFDGELGELSANKHIDGFDVDYTQRIGGGPLDLGFDYWFGISGSLDMPPYCFIENDRTVGVPDREKEHYEAQQRKGMMTPGWKDDQCDVKFAEKACEFIRTRADNQEKPFFLYLTPAAPHRPCVPPDFIKGQSQAGLRGDAVCLVDWMVGEVLKTLRDKGIEENTLLIVTSDNGARATCFNGKDYGHKSNGYWRGQKADIWEGGHREPFIAQWPEKIRPGSMSGDLVCLSDFFATVADVLDRKIPEGAGEDSVSFLPVFSGGNSSRESLVHHSGDGMFSVRKGEWKFVLGLGSGGFSEPKTEPVGADGVAGQLYNLAKDPAETTNLYKKHPEIVEELTGILRETQGD